MAASAHEFLYHCPLRLKKIYLRCHIQRQVPVLAFEPMVVANCCCLYYCSDTKFACFLGSAIAAPIVVLLQILKRDIQSAGQLFQDFF